MTSHPPGKYRMTNSDRQAVLVLLIRLGRDAISVNPRTVPSACLILSMSQTSHKDANSVLQ
jgi:hypothetical protein